MGKLMRRLFAAMVSAMLVFSALSVGVHAAPVPAGNEAKLSFPDEASPAEAEVSPAEAEGITAAAASIRSLRTAAAGAARNRRLPRQSRQQGSC